MDGTTKLAAYAAVVATASVLWQIYVHVVVRRENRRRDASGVVGRLVSLLWYLNPETGLVGGIPRDRVNDAITSYADRWEPIRADLETLRIARPRIAAKVKAAMDAAQESMNYSFWAMREADRAVHADLWDNLRERYIAATNAARTLEDAVRRL